MKKIYLTPGPTQIHTLAKQAIAEALDSDLCSVSHRSAQYENLQSNTESQLRKLLSIPDSYKIFFLSSGTECWERIIQNAVIENSTHLVNGSFSRRFYETALELGKKSSAVEAPLGQGFIAGNIKIDPKCELICLTQNETSSGVALDSEIIRRLRIENADSLLAVDAVSCAPFATTDLNQVDYYFFSVQKFFCLPSGLGVLIASPAALDRAKDLKRQGIIIGAHHNLLNLTAFSDKHQTPSTPNILAIYLLGRISEYFNKTGIDKIRQYTISKANLIYDCLDQAKNLKAFVQNPEWQSKTVITVNAGERAIGVKQALESQGLVVGDGYGKFKDSQFRIANFSAHALEDFKRLAEALSQYRYYCHYRQLVTCKRPVLASLLEFTSWFDSCQIPGEIDVFLPR